MLASLAYPMCTRTVKGTSPNKAHPFLSPLSINLLHS
ncbi:hypothetical protein TorRG33x02_152610 [Trema orientale]|uniref:Uncharacterized protein n=1 Tax=Trema orientale TaxID=63057 RepID=A0A2P5EU16_TREOI|nr:hypothetical protein TorRG33x02_152610 [Trema orientale]